MKGKNEREGKKVMESKGYHKLLVWQRARELVKLVYLLTESFPKAEEYGLKSQIRRAVISIVLNIVQGYRRGSTKDYLHFLNIAQASLVELEASLEISLDLGFIQQKEYQRIETKRGEVSFLLFQLTKSLKNK